MFNWLKRSGDSGARGLEQMRADFGQMLGDGRHMFNTAANALLGGTDPDVIRQDLLETDKRINRAEQKIRREIVVHATVHGTSEFPACLVLMSVVKDAERVGDFCKNLFDLAEMVPEPPSGEFKDDLVRLKDEISQLMADCHEAFDKEDKVAASALIKKASALKDICDDQVVRLVSRETEVRLAPAYVMAYRYFKRVASHSFNVATSVVQPIDKLDFSLQPDAVDVE